ncbi:TetR family transcriptional regulator [Agreia sp. COWG]|nr:TetR family transcriptional regulator [Agreia sp. COWG]
MSRERLVRAAIEILDADGEGALTFRALAHRLSTGSGAMYHYVANKDELLTAATDAVIADVVTGVAGPRDPSAAIRSLALGVFDAIDLHPWVGTQLVREPWQFAIIQLFERIGTQLQALGVPAPAQFDSASALVNYVLGLAGQYAAGARLLARDTNRTAFLGMIAAEWERLDRHDFPFMHQMADGLHEHDDRAQFLAGIDLILAGIESIR